MKISEAFDRYKTSEVIAMNYSPSTLTMYNNLCSGAIKYFGDVNIKRIDIDDVHNFYIWLIGRVSKNTARHYISSLRVVLRFCRKRGINVLNPDEIKVPCKEKKIARFITKEEYRRFISAAAEPVRGYPRVNLVRNVLIIRTLRETGLRVGELCALDRDTIKGRQFVVIGKSKEPRQCFITKELEQMLNMYLKTRTDDNPALFISNQTGERVNKHLVELVFRNVSKKSGVHKVTPHTLRHLYATNMIENGADIRVVATLLGHQNISTTQIYTHVMDEFLRRTYSGIMENGSESFPQDFGIFVYGNRCKK